MKKDPKMSNFFLMTQKCLIFLKYDPNFLRTKNVSGNFVTKFHHYLQVCLTYMSKIVCMYVCVFFGHFFEASDWLTYLLLAVVLASQRCHRGGPARKLVTSSHIAIEVIGVAQLEETNN